MVEVPLFPGDGEEMVMFVAESVMPGLLTVTVVVPRRSRYRCPLHR